jgi:hypothetical protein
MILRPALAVCCLRYRPASRETVGGNELMDIAEAKARLDALLDELAAAGFSVWGWDDETIQIGRRGGPGAECAPRHVVDDRQAG